MRVVAGASRALDGLPGRCKLCRAAAHLRDAIGRRAVGECVAVSLKLDERSSKPANPSQPGSAGAATPQEYGAECGGKGGVPYVCVFQPPARLVKVTVWHRNYIDGIQLETDLGVLPRIGGTGRHRDVHQETIALAKDEVLLGITVMYWQYVDQISFHTNKRSYGAYGGAAGQVTRTILSPPGRKVVGFKGRHWELVDSIQLMVA